MSVVDLSAFNWAGGHCTQRIQRALGIAPSLRPSGQIKRLAKASPKGVFVHMSTNTDWKRSVPNTLSQQNQDEVIRFFNLNPEYRPYYFNNNLSLPLMAEIMESCEFFLGIDSGPMHLAAALGLKSIVLINSPENSIMLPKIRECDIPNSEWLYPQNCHLNTAGENQLVPKFSVETLERAFNGEIYPYWSEEFLPLYFEINFDMTVQ